MFKFSVTAAIILSLSFNSFAASVEDVIKNKMLTINENLVVESIEKTPWDGMYEVTLGSGESIFSDAKGEYLVVGQMFSLTPEDGFVNLTEKKMQKSVVKALNAVDDKELIIYPAKGEELASITVFTDISCFYCQKLHDNLPQIQESGVTVKYMAFPRAGMQSDVASQMESVWCADAPTKALTTAKSKKRVPDIQCDNPVASQYALGQKIGVRATPTIFLADGQMLPGFASVERLLNDLGLL